MKATKPCFQADLVCKIMTNANENILLIVRYDTVQIRTPQNQTTQNKLKQNKTRQIDTNHKPTRKLYIRKCHYQSFGLSLVNLIGSCRISTVMLKHHYWKKMHSLLKEMHALVEEKHSLLEEMHLLYSYKQVLPQNKIPCNLTT